MNDPIQELMDEHRVIEKVLSALEGAHARDVPFSFYETAADFIVEFADGCHHDKEEKRLFPMLEERGIPRDYGPIGVMCEEHEIGRACVRKLREGIAATDVAVVRAAAADYVTLLRAHIQKEDEVLFPMGRSRLAAADVVALRASFDEVKSTYDKYNAIADELLEQVSTPA